MSRDKRHQWWQKTVFYEIYIASFQDGNGDGMGDFAGLGNRLSPFGVLISQEKKVCL